METQVPAASEANALPDPALYGPQAQGGRPRKKAKRGGDEPSLSITSLMDVLTIILVFLLKSYSNNPVQLKQANDLQLPFSKAKSFPQESTAVTITGKYILVDDKPVVTLENTKVSESDLSGGGLLIDPLYQKLLDAVDHEKKVARFQKNREFQGILTVIADRDVSYSLIVKVMYTAGQATFGKFKFAVINEDAS